MESQTHEAVEKSALRGLLDEARERTLQLVGALSDEELRRQHDPLMSPIVWDLGHIAHFEEVWLLENLEGAGDGSEGLRGIYNPFENPRAVRDELTLPSREECFGYMDEVRTAVLEKLDRLDLDAGAPLLRGGFGFNLVLQHEYQHNETILQTLQLKSGPAYPMPFEAERPAPTAVPRPAEAMVSFPGGQVWVGSDDRSRAYDNERPRISVRVSPFQIDRAPVTNAAFSVFIADGGYENDSLWSEAGRAWRDEQGLEAPKFWQRKGGEWWTRVLGHSSPVDPDCPVCHVCYYEADAYARWAGKRLPTEIEWEVAASWDGEAGRARSYPWGEDPATARLANVDARRRGAAPVGTYPKNVSAMGCYGMIGDVWEWTSSDFLPYPGYETFPYPEYSEVFFGDEYKVLRGGSWATRPGAIRNTFRNWDYPIRRQIFSGFRCARDD